MLVTGASNAARPLVDRSTVALPEALATSQSAHAQSAAAGASHQSFGKRRRQTRQTPRDAWRRLHVRRQVMYYMYFVVYIITSYCGAFRQKYCVLTNCRCALNNVYMCTYVHECILNLKFYAESGPVVEILYLLSNQIFYFCKAVTT